MRRWRKVLAAMLASCALAVAEGAEEMHMVEGDCLVEREGVLVAYVVDEKGFASPLKGLREAKLQVGPAEVASGRVRFAFILPTGRYGIRSFIDVNGNGRLDGGPLGPTEPWGMSWNGARRPGFPRFDDIAFVVDKDVHGILVEVK